MIGCLITLIMCNNHWFACLCDWLIDWYGWFSWLACLHHLYDWFICTNAWFVWLSWLIDLEIWKIRSFGGIITIFYQQNLIRFYFFQLVDSVNYVLHRPSPTNPNMNILATSLCMSTKNTISHTQYVTMYYKTFTNNSVTYTYIDFKIAQNR